jgi:hypothetical protein
MKQCSTKQRTGVPLLSGLMQRNPCFTYVLRFVRARGLVMLKCIIVLQIFRKKTYLGFYIFFFVLENSRERKRATEKSYLKKDDVRLDITIDINTKDDENDAFDEEEYDKRAMLRFVLFSARVVSLVVVEEGGKEEEEEEGCCWFQR